MLEGWAPFHPIFAAKPPLIKKNGRAISARPRNHQSIKKSINRRFGFRLFPVLHPHIPTDASEELIPLETIAAVLADGNNTRLLCGSREYPDRRAFCEWMELLEGLPFLELDRSTALRMDQVVSWNSHGTGGLVTLRNAANPIELGRTAYRRFRELLAEAGDA